MWALYDRYHRTYVANRNDESKKWVYESECGNPSSTSKNNHPNLKEAESQPYYPRPASKKKQEQSPRSSFSSQNNTSSLLKEEQESVSSHGISSGDSSRRHSQTYEDVRDLNTDLYKMAKNTKASPSSRDRRLRYLFDESVDCMFRHHLSHHQPPPGLGPSEISYHMYDNNVQFPHPRSYKTRAEMQHGLGGTSSGEGGKALNLQGLVPFLTPSDQMNILKAKEKKLLLNRWRETWESVRPPRPGWHEMKGPGFAEEAKRARELLVSPDMQRASQQTRLAILELWRTEVTDRVLFHAPFEGEGGVEDFDGESLRPGGIQELKRMESEALHASIERHGDPGRKALAPWTSSGMRRTTRSFD